MLAIAILKNLIRLIFISSVIFVGYQNTPWVLEQKAKQHDIEVRNIVREWCRLAEFPNDRTKENIQVSGGMFTREFQMVFTANESELKQWIKNSVGLQDAEISTTSGNTKEYNIQPHEASYCVVLISPKGRVSIITYWS